MSTIYFILTILGFLITIIVFLNKINMLANYVDDLESEITSLQSHTDGAFKGVYFDMVKVKDELKNHMHKYEFKDGILYIQEPIIVEPNNEESND